MGDSTLKSKHLNLSAAQFAALGLFGTLIAMGVIALPRHVLTHLGLFFGFLIYMTPVLLGLGLYLWAIAQLKDGVQNGIWAEDQLARRYGASHPLALLSRQSCWC